MRVEKVNVYSRKKEYAYFILTGAKSQFRHAGDGLEDQIAAGSWNVDREKTSEIPLGAHVEGGGNGAVLTFNAYCILESRPDAPLSSHQQGRIV